MRYFFILGNNPTLSFAELATFFDLSEASHFIFQDGYLVADMADSFNAQQAISRLGGTVKIGRIIGQAGLDSIDAIKKLILAAISKEAEKKVKFGISDYTRRHFNIERLGLEVKKELKSRGQNARLVVSRERQLSSVVVEQNRLVRDGLEAVLLSDGRKILIGQTISVQLFKELSRRDYGRPARDDHSGMLPPKLAQIMINLAHIEKDAILLDPFCGSGTILSESALMGYQNLIGSDISAKAISDTKTNIEWMVKNYDLEIKIFKTIKSDGRQLSNGLKPYSIDAIITEPYLGPQRGKIDAVRIKRDLAELYAGCLAEFYKILKPDGRIVMVWPVIRTAKAGWRKPNQDYSLLNVSHRGWKIINPFPDSIRSFRGLDLTSRGTIIYGREGQKIWREIVILEKIK